jgi:chromosome segregation protein
MYLNRIEINGFKSFANKTVFEFPSGIVGIVGPNGSGKSNIIDAVRWILGEREAKQLRGDKGEDLIFAGTDKKPRMSQAQVTLVFDNSTGDFPIDFSEVVVTRKIARNGNSEYLINDASVRLKDIVDLFSKMRLGSKGLAVIGQGSGDVFVASSSQQRMMMVQEILGLREYELKKHEAQRNLTHTTANLEKLSAMIQEVAPRLRALKRQTAKWEKREEVVNALTAVQEKFFVAKIADLLEQQKALDPLRKALMQQKEHSAKELVSAQEALQQVEQSADTKEIFGTLQKKKQEQFIQQRDLERTLARIDVTLEQLTQQGPQEFSLVQAKETLVQIEKDLEAVKVAHDVEMVRQTVEEVLVRIKKLFGSTKESDNQKQRVQLMKQRDDIVSQLTIIASQLEEVTSQEQNIAQGAQEFQQRFKEAFSQVEQLKHAQREQESQEQKLQFEKEKIEYKIQELRHQAETFEVPFDVFQVKAEKVAHSTSLTTNELDAMEKEMMRLRGELASIGDIDTAVVNEAQEVETHHDFLKKEYADLEDASQNLRIVIGELESTMAQKFEDSFKKVNQAFHEYFGMMFGGGSAKMKVVTKQSTIEQDQENDQEDVVLPSGIEIEVSIPRKKITGLEMLSGGERSLVSLAVLFALVSVSPPPFLVLDEVDAALDEKNSDRFGQLIKTFSGNTQFIVVTHNRVTMEAADILYGVTMDDAGVSKVLSLKLEDAKEVVGERG